MQYDDIMRVLSKLKERAKQLIEYGYAYAIAHPEYIKNKLNCDIETLNKVLKDGKKYAGDPCYDKRLKYTWVNCILSVIRLGFKYILNNPEAYNEFNDFESIFEEYESVVKNYENQQAREEPRSRNHETYTINHNDMSIDDIFRDTFNQLNELTKRLESINNRTYTLKKSPVTEYAHQRYRDGLVNFKNKILQKLDDINRHKEKRMRQYEAMMRQDDSPTDEERSSEVLLNYENFTRRLTPKKTPARAGPIERKIVIPVITDDPSAIPKVTPRMYLRRHENGTMKMDVKLNFDNGIICDGQLVDEICIESDLPGARRRRNF